MPKIRFGNGATFSFTDGHGTAEFVGLLPNSLTDATEADIRVKDYAGLTYEDLWGRASAHTGGFNMVWTFRNNGSDSTNLVATATSAAVVEDNTGTEAVTANNSAAVKLLDNGMHGDDGTYFATLVSAAGGSGNYVGGSYTSTASADSYFGLYSDLLATTDQARFKIDRATVFSNLRIAAANAITGDFAHYDGAKSTNLVITDPAAGENEDTTGTESNAADDSIGFFWDHTSGTFESEVFQMSTDVDEVPRGYVRGWTWLASTTYYLPFLQGTGDGDTTDANGVSKHAARIGAEDVQFLHLYVTSFGTPSNPKYSAYINTTESTNVTVVPSGTGWNSDTTGSDTLADDDLLGSIRTIGSPSGVSHTVAQFEVPGGAAGTVASLPHLREHPMQAHLLRR